jgi:hypothetical protein
VITAIASLLIVRIPLATMSFRILASTFATHIYSKRNLQDYLFLIVEHLYIIPSLRFGWTLWRISAHTLSLWHHFIRPSLYPAGRPQTPHSTISSFLGVWICARGLVNRMLWYTPLQAHVHTGLTAAWQSCSCPGVHWTTCPDDMISVDAVGSIGATDMVVSYNLSALHRTISLAIL